MHPTKIRHTDAGMKPAPRKPPGITTRVPPTVDFNITKIVATLEEPLDGKESTSSDIECKRGRISLTRGSRGPVIKGCVTPDLTSTSPQCLLLPRKSPSCAMSLARPTSGYKGSRNCKLLPYFRTPTSCTGSRKGSLKSRAISSLEDSGKEPPATCMNGKNHHRQ